MQSSKFYKKLVSLLLILVLVGAGLFAWQNKWELHDRWVSRSYKATGDSTEVLNNLSLTPKGELVYKASLTEVDDKSKFRSRCPVEEYEEANVLGCYSARRIYVLKVDEPRLNGVEEVTAAHELLHAQFERMDAGERKNLRIMLTKLKPEVTDIETNNLIGSYKAKLGDSEDLYNEMFAVYGTQLDSVGKDLEEIYSKYFKDRAKIVASYKSYSSEFTSIQNKLNEYDSRLTKLKSQKEELETEAQTLNDELNQEKAELDSLSSGDSAEQYQVAAESYNQKVREYNALVEQIRSIIEEYNSIVDERNSLALSAKNLQDQLNANITER